MPIAPHQSIRALVARLLPWFRSNARDLPWRRILDPYAIWISEIMLQQTQVRTVIPYWERWMRELPTVGALARAKPEKVLKLWEGLGYYTRARNLQKAAQKIVAEHGARFPEKFEEILALPGVGRYTAGAIASIAFNQATPILDGNVIRVIARLFGIQEDPKEDEVNRRLWLLSQNLVECARLQSGTGTRLNRTDRPLLFAGPCSLLNQSLMELGALVCTPRAPRCDVCPVQRSCTAKRMNCVEALPNPGKRPVTVARRFVAFVVRRGKRFLVRQRPAGVVNAHLWEFPNRETTANSTTPRVAAHRVLGASVEDPRPLLTVRHSITRYRILLEVFCGTTSTGFRSGGHWFTTAELDQFAFTSAHRRILQHIIANNGARLRKSNKF